MIEGTDHNKGVGEEAALMVTIETFVASGFVQKDNLLRFVRPVYTDPQSRCL